MGTDGFIDILNRLNFTWTMPKIGYHVTNRNELKIKMFFFLYGTILLISSIHKKFRSVSVLSNSTLCDEGPVHREQFSGRWLLPVRKRCLLSVMLIHRFINTWTSISTKLIYNHSTLNLCALELPAIVGGPNIHLTCQIYTRPWSKQKGKKYATLIAVTCGTHAK